MVFKDVDPIKQVTVLDVQWSNLDEEIVDEVREFWRNNELGNDYYYVTIDIHDDEDLPLTTEYLKSRGIETCLMHFWW